MRTGLRAALIAALAAATLVFAASALAANSAKIAVSSAGAATTLHITVPQATDAIAVTNIYVPAGYTANLSQAVGTEIGKVDSTALAHDGGLTLPLSGPVATANPVAPATDVCAPGTHAAIWNLNLSVAGQTLVVPLYVDPTSGAEAALGAYRMRICLPPWDTPPGSPGRAFQGAQLLDAGFTVNGIFTAPTSGLSVWHTLFTPFNPGVGTVNLAGTFEARALVGVPSISLKATKKNGRYTVSGTLTEGGLPTVGASVLVLRGSSATRLASVGKATTSATGAWSASGRLVGKKPVYFKATAVAAERDATATGCATPLPPTVVPGGCVSATLPKLSLSSPVASLKP